MKQTHTPGPWEYVPNEFNCDDDNGDHIGSIKSEKLFVAAIDDVHPDGAALANAYLIAAAPDLLKACEGILNDAAARPGAYLYADLMFIRAAVTKANIKEAA